MDAICPSARLTGRPANSLVAARLAKYWRLPGQYQHEVGKVSFPNVLRRMRKCLFVRTSWQASDAKQQLGDRHVGVKHRHAVESAFSKNAARACSARPGSLSANSVSAANRACRRLAEPVGLTVGANTLRKIILTLSFIERPCAPATMQNRFFKAAPSLRTAKVLLVQVFIALSLTMPSFLGVMSKTQSEKLT